MIIKHLELNVQKYVSFRSGKFGLSLKSNFINNIMMISAYLL